MLMSDVIDKVRAESSNVGSDATPSAEVYAVYGVEPEILAYAMAKYSRSALSMKESLREISQQKAEKFLNTFYFQYGHRSIADLAHIALAIERLSILAAIAVADEQRWDGQERSTRYQDFKKRGFTMMASIFDGPDWLVLDPQDKQHRTVDPNKYVLGPEDILFIKTWREPDFTLPVAASAGFTMELMRVPPAASASGTIFRSAKPVGIRITGVICPT